MWRAAVVHATALNGMRGGPVSIHHLGYALPSNAARQVQFLSNVTLLEDLPSLKGPSSPSGVQQATTSLLKFPDLKACLVPEGAFRVYGSGYCADNQWYNMGIKFNGMRFIEYADSLRVSIQKLVPFEIEPQGNIRQEVEYLIKIQAASGVKILSRQKWGGPEPGTIMVRIGFLGEVCNVI